MPNFEFDAEKSAANLAKHRIDFEAAQALWDDPDKVSGLTSYPDEDRWLIVGAIDGKLWCAVVTERGDDIRIISVRRARPNEAKAYELKTPLGG